MPLRLAGPGPPSASLLPCRIEPACPVLRHFGAGRLFGGLVRNVAGGWPCGTRLAAGTRRRTDRDAGDPAGRAADTALVKSQADGGRLSGRSRLNRAAFRAGWRTHSPSRPGLGERVPFAQRAITTSRRACCRGPSTSNRAPRPTRRCCRSRSCGPEPVRRSRRRGTSFLREGSAVRSRPCRA